MIDTRILAVTWDDPAIVAAWIGLGGIVLGALVTVWTTLRGEKKAAAAGPTTAQQPPSPTWTDTDSGFLLKRTAQADVLVIFVHGILGSPMGTWARLPDLIAEYHAQFDILRYRYPAGLLDKCGIEEAARDLSTDLRENFADYNHLVFITHSTGGLVVKKLLLDDMTMTLERMMNPEVDYEDIGSITTRSRQVINIAVPHSGGSILASLVLIPLYHLLLPLLFVIWGVVTVWRTLWRKQRKGYVCGYNKIVWQLRFGNAWLARLESRQNELESELDAKWLPRPETREVHGANDTTIASAIADVPTAPGDTPSSPQRGRRATYAEDQPLVFRGTHPLVKSAKSARDSIVVFLAGFLERYRRPGEALLAREILTRTLTLDRAVGLLGPVAEANAANNAGGQP